MFKNLIRATALLGAFFVSSETFAEGYYYYGGGYAVPVVPAPVYVPRVIVAPVYVTPVVRPIVVAPVYHGYYAVPVYTPVYPVYAPVPVLPYPRYILRGRW
jgi:hypothetical protein